MLTRNHFRPKNSSLLYYAIVTLLTSIIGTFFVILSLVETWTKIQLAKVISFYSCETKEVLLEFLSEYELQTFKLQTPAANFKHPSGYAVGDNPKLQYPFSGLFPSVNGAVDQCKLLYKNKSSPVEVAIPCLPGNHVFPAFLAEGLSRFSQIKVTVVIPECDFRTYQCSWLKIHSQECGYHMVEAKKRPGFDDPLGWLIFPPEGFKTDMVIGVGRELGKIAQLWKEHYQCKNIYIEYPLDILHVQPDQPYDYYKCPELIKEADVAVATGLKMCDELSRDLSYEKPVFNLTPGIINHFCDISHGDVNTPERKFHVLCLGSDDPNCFKKGGFGIAAKALAQNGKSYRLTYVGSVTNKSQLAKKFRHCGVAETQLDFQSLPRGMEDWKRLLSRADLAIMPSGLKAFGLEALFALSAGLPVLVHAESGFGEALKVVKFGTSAIVDSDDAGVWAEKIRKVRETDKKTRLGQATELRANYDETYNWEKQCGELVKMMVKMVSA